MSLSSITRNIIPRLYEPVQCLQTMTRNFSTKIMGCRQMMTPLTGSQSGLLTTSHTSSSPQGSKDSTPRDLNCPPSRSYMRIYYKPSAWKRYNKHNIEKRLSTPGGIEVLWKRVLKGRHNLAVYERIVPNTVDSKILANHQTRFRKHPLTRHKIPIKTGLF